MIFGEFRVHLPPNHWYSLGIIGVRASDRFQQKQEIHCQIQDFVKTKQPYWDSNFSENAFLWKSARWRQTPLKVYRKALVIQCFARWGRAGPKDGIWMHFFDSEVQFFGKSQEKCCGDWKITEFQHLWLSQTICFPCPKAASVRSGHFHRSLAPKSAYFHKNYDFYVKNAFLIQK